MGLIADTPELYTFVCDSCDATYTGRPHEVVKLGWVRHEYSRAGMRRKGEFLICVDCEKYYAPAWKRNVEKAA